MSEPKEKGPATSQKFRISVPPNLDEVFSVQNMNFTEMKSYIKTIFETLQRMGIRMEDLDGRFMSKLNVINETEKSMK